MGYRIEIEPERNLVKVIVDGEFRIEGIREYRETLRQDSRFRKDMGRLIDLRTARPTLTTNDVIQASDLYKDDPLASKLAFVVPTDEFYGLVRMFQQWALDDQHVGVFYDLDDALTWLAAGPAPQP